MTDYDSMKVFADESGNLVDINGKVIVPVEKRRACLVYSRVVGYLSPVSIWNKGKKAEWADRVDFVAPKIGDPFVEDGGSDV